MRLFKVITSSIFIGLLSGAAVLSGQRGDWGWVTFDLLMILWQVYIIVTALWPTKQEQMIAEQRRFHASISNIHGEEDRTRLAAQEIARLVIQSSSKKTWRLM